MFGPRVTVFPAFLTRPKGKRFLHGILGAVKAAVRDGYSLPYCVWAARLAP
jgi:hypothetical protein